MWRLLTGPRGKWVVVAAWLLVAAAAVALGLPGRFAAAQENDSAAYLPAGAESTRLLEATAGAAETTTAVVVFRRRDGLTAADRERVAAAQRDLGFDELDFAPGDDAALLVGDLPGGPESEALPAAVEDVRRRVGDPGGGLAVAVTGEAGFAADAEAVFDTIDATLLLAAGALVVALLLAIYRSPLLVVVPLTCVAAADLLLRAVGAGAAEAGLAVDGQSASIVAVLMLGAGTDYALLLVARYREELRRRDDHHEALALALGAAGPAIAASAATVAAALLCLGLAETQSTRALGPIGALGIGAAMVAMLTLLPALLAVAGRRAFWRPPVAGLSDGIPRPGDGEAGRGAARWLALGRRVQARPRRTWAGVTAALAVLSLGWLALDTGLSPADNFRGDVESVTGQALIASAFSAGASAPTEVLLPRGRESARSALEFAVRDAPGVEAVSWDEPTRAGTVLRAVLEPDPYSPAAYDLIPGLRRAARAAAGPGVLVGGPTAEGRDLREAAARDTRIIVPAALAVVFLVLAALLRALAGPLALMGTVVLSFAASVGLCLLLFAALGMPAIDPSLPLYAFVFLVALGTDYNIFLMARVREHARVHGTREAVPHSLAATGAVITSAGLVLAGTFLVLVLLPLTFLIQMGLVIAVGVLLDTFVVRSLLVPAIVTDLGEHTWWPRRHGRS